MILLEKIAYQTGYDSAFKCFNIKQAKSITATNPNLGLTQTSNTNTIPLSPPMQSSPLAGANTANMNNKPFAPITATPGGAKPAS